MSFLDWQLLAMKKTEFTKNGLYVKVKEKIKKGCKLEVFWKIN